MKMMSPLALFREYEVYVQASVAMRRSIHMYVQDVAAQNLEREISYYKKAHTIFGEY